MLTVAMSYHVSFFVGKTFKMKLDSYLIKHVFVAVLLLINCNNYNFVEECGAFFKIKSLMSRVISIQSFALTLPNYHLLCQSGVCQKQNEEKDEWQGISTRVRIRMEFRTI
jgi:hypothetical protein